MNNTASMTENGNGLRQGYQDSTGRTTLTYDGQNIYRRDVQSIGSVQRYTSEPGNYSPLISQADTRSGVTTHIYAVSDLSGNIRNWWSSGTRGNLDPYAYEAYGVEWITPAPEPPISYNVPFFYEGDVGYYQDATTGLYYVKARWYDPVTGRFMGEDPEWPEGGWNPYEFVENNPVNLVDVDGMVPRLTRQPIPIPPTDPGDLPGNCSIYKWLYTGDWCAPDDVYNAAIGGGADGLTCWANCFVDANKQILAIVAAAAGTSPAWGATKPIQWMRPGARPLTSVARLINIQVRQRFGSAAADKIGTQALADFIKEHPTIAAAELAAVVFAWAEAAISAYCAAQCVNSSCNINNDQ
jgi:RHS repeat-associated protein